MPFYHGPRVVEEQSHLTAIFSGGLELSNIASYCQEIAMRGSFMDAWTFMEVPFHGHPKYLDCILLCLDASYEYRIFLV